MTHERRLYVKASSAGKLAERPRTRASTACPRIMLKGIIEAHDTGYLACRSIVCLLSCRPTNTHCSRRLWRLGSCGRLGFSYTDGQTDRWAGGQARKKDRTTIFELWTPKWLRVQLIGYKHKDNCDSLNRNLLGVVQEHRNSVGPSCLPCTRFAAPILEPVKIGRQGNTVTKILKAGPRCSFG